MAGASDGSASPAILELIQEFAQTSAAPIPAGRRLDEVGLDSLGYAELALAAEERLGLRAPDDGIAGGTTVGELTSMLAAAPHVERPVPLASPEETPDSPDTDPGRELSHPRHGLGRMQRPGDILAGGLFRHWFRLSVQGAEHMPSTGPVILCMNHESLLDIPLAVIASPRPVTFMAKKELFRKRVGGWLLQELGAFPVDRERFDLKAIRLALGVLSRGEVLGMYPEGTRTAGRLLPFLRGAAWLAMRTGCPLLPAGIKGTEVAWPRGQRLPRRVPVSLRFGDPIEVEALTDRKRRRTEAEGLTQRLRSSIEFLLT
jgi:1-acyl-sn-glycerol-3-phosphate acyltransferase